MAFKGALVKKSADQTLANYTTVTTLTFNSEVYDVGGWHDNVTNNTRLTVPAGVTRVRLRGQVSIGNISTNQWIYADFRKNNGVPDVAVNVIPNNDMASPRHALISPVFDVVEGDYFEMRLQVSGDTSVTIVASETWFSIESVE